MTDEADEFIRAVMADMLDKHQGLPREPVGVGPASVNAHLG